MIPCYILFPTFLYLKFYENIVFLMKIMTKTPGLKTGSQRSELICRPELCEKLKLMQLLTPKSRTYTKLLLTKLELFGIPKHQASRLTHPRSGDATTSFYHNT
jgi:hypothetical protein